MPSQQRLLDRVYVILFAKHLASASHRIGTQCCLLLLGSESKSPKTHTNWPIICFILFNVKISEEF